MGRRDLTGLGQDLVRNAAALFATGYRAHRERQPLLPARFESPAAVESLLCRMVGRRPGVAAVRDGRLTGYLAGGVIPEWRGCRTAFVPFWAHAVSGERRGRLFEDLYAALSSRWTEDGCSAHLVSAFAGDDVITAALFRLGHGIAVIDAMRGVDPVRRNSSAVTVRRAGPADRATWHRLREGLVDHLAGSPAFMHVPGHKPDDYYQRWLGDPGHAVWLAELGGELAGYMQISRLDEEVVVTDEHTAGIQGAFTVPHLRSGGIATALLDRCLAWARENGFDRCAVDFEGENVLGRRFWLRHFEPVCYSVVRHLDPRVAATSGA